MTLRFEFKSNGEVVAQNMGALVERLEDTRVLLEDFGVHMLGSVRANFDAGGRPDPWPRSDWTPKGAKTQHYTGRLQRSVTYRASRERLEIGTNLRSAAQRHFGGDLVPKVAKTLAVPCSGVPPTRRRPKSWPDLVFIPSKTKGDTVGVLASKPRRKGGKFVARFVLKKKVHQEARPFLMFQDEDMAYVSRRLVELASTGRLS